MTLKRVYAMDPTTSTSGIEGKLLYLSESPSTDEQITLKKHRDYTNEGILVDNDGTGAETSLVKTVSNAFGGGAGTVTLGLNISGLTAVGTTPATDDYLQIYQTSTSDIKKISIANLVTAAAGGGDVTGPALSVDKTIPRFDGATGKTIKVSGVSISDVNVVTASGFTGPLTGNVTGNVTGDLSGDVNGDVTGNLTGNVTGNVTGALTGNADTATALQTPRDILGQAFDGTASITADITDLSDVYSAMTPVDGQILTYDPTNGWQAETFPGGTGTVQSIGISVTSGTGIAVSGTNPVTTTGTINLALGSIPNTSLTNSTMSIAGQSSTLGGADTPISIQNLSDVDSASPSDNDVLQYNTATGEYIPTALGTGGTVTSVGFVGGDGISFTGTTPVTGDNIGTEATFTVDLADTATFTSANTVSKAVVRDGFGNFAAGTITAALTGNVAGDLTGDVTGDLTGTASIATTVTVADTTDTTTFVGLWESATGDLEPKTDAGITYNAGTGMLTATGFTGPLTGNATNITGNLAVANLNSGTDAAVGKFWQGNGTWAAVPSTGDPAGTAVAMAIALGG
jgi:hypothetical protein